MPIRWHALRNYVHHFVVVCRHKQHDLLLPIWWHALGNYVLYVLLVCRHGDVLLPIRWNALGLYVYHYVCSYQVVLLPKWVHPTYFV
ncbi:MAG: hypothetical protein ACYDD6_10950 [Acidimicrobiales bacterium]